VLPLLSQFARLATLAAIVAAGSACSTVRTYDDRIKPIYSSYQRGEFDLAAQKASEGKKDRRHTSTDRLLWALEAGKLHQAAGDFEKSNTYFARAEAIVRDFEERPDLNLRAGAAQISAIATNPNALPYQGNYADKIMINTYKALNYIILGDLEAARVEIRRSNQRQRQAVTENNAALEDAKRTATTKRLSPQVTYENPAFQRTASVDPTAAAAYADFANPFTTFLSGLIYLADQDPARAEVDFRILASLPIPNSFIQKELDLIQQQLEGQGANDQTRVFVIFENGLGPTKQEMRVDLILPNLGYTGFAFPEIVFHPSRVRALSISLPGTSDQLLTQQIASMDQILATEFRLRLPAMVLRTLTSVIAKEVAAKQLTDELGGLGLILGSLYKAMVNRADTRTWHTLGKEFQIATLDILAPGELTFSLMTRDASEPIRPQVVPLPEGNLIVVLAQSVNQHDLRITVRKLR
jgi:uncharacterized protein